MRLGKGRMPPTDGESKWRYPQGSVMIRADDREELTRRIFEYRLRNNIGTESIEEDVDRWYCDKYPSFCFPSPRDGNPKAPWSSNESMLHRVSRWVAAAIHKTPRGGYPLVTSQVAEERATICAGCVMNIAWRGGCGGCSASTLQLLQQLKQLKKTKQDGSLRGCSIGGWENSTSVWLNPELMPVTTDQRDSMPAHCWRKTAA